VGGKGKRFLCPHCCRAGGKLGGIVQGEMVCDLCVKDGCRIREIVKLIYRANPKARGSGLASPLLLLKLFIGWCEAKQVEGDFLDEAREMFAAWRTADATDQSEVAAREGRYNG
jgi:hypothetical protein